MGRLGNHFPKGARQEHVSRNLKPGQVLYLFCDFTNPPKDKYVVLVCAEERPLFFLINSRINDFVRKRPALFRCQVALSVADYGFLDHDSFADCSKVLDSFGKQDLEQQLLSTSVARIKGELNGKTKEQIARVVQKAKTISPKHKALIVRALKG
jgi:hypothetical protein